MREAFDLLIGLELVPHAGVDARTDALDVEEALEIDQAVGLKAEVVDVIVPAGVLAESAEIDAALLRVARALAEDS